MGTMPEARLTTAELRQVIRKLSALDDDRAPPPSCMPPDYWETIRRLDAEGRQILADLLEDRLQKMIAEGAADDHG